jgi:hypothetical protein
MMFRISKPAYRSGSRRRRIYEADPGVKRSTVIPDFKRASMNFR